MLLQDGRILSYGNHYKYYKLYVYNLKNKNFCDIIYDTERINNMIQMDDGKVIILESNNIIKVIDIKEKEIIVLQTIETLKNNEQIDYSHYNKIFKLSKNNILIWNCQYKINIFPYIKGEIIEENYGVEVDLDSHNNYGNIQNIYIINENEIVIYCYIIGFFTNYYLVFYNVKKDKEINSIKFGRGYGTSRLCILNKSQFIFIRHDKKTIYLIDNEKYKILNEIKFEDEFQSLIALNEKNFLIIFEKDHISQYEVTENNKKFKIKEVSYLYLIHKFCGAIIRKFNGNRLIIFQDEGIYLFGLPNK